MPYGNMDLGQHWLIYWLIAWWHQAITNVDLSSVRSSDIHLKAISQEMIHKLENNPWGSELIFYQLDTMHYAETLLMWTELSVAELNT